MKATFVIGADCGAAFNIYLKMAKLLAGDDIILSDLDKNYSFDSMEIAMPRADKDEILITALVKGLPDDNKKFLHLICRLLLQSGIEITEHNIDPSHELDDLVIGHLQMIFPDASIESHRHNIINVNIEDSQYDMVYNIVLSS